MAASCKSFKLIGRSMLKLDSYIAKMSESNILEEYSVYLQMLSLRTDLLKVKKPEVIAAKSMLTYAEFKEYYISGLTGKDNFIDGLVNKLQFGLTPH